MHDDKKYYVESEIGTLRKLIIHSPDGGIGKIIPSTFSDNLYDDIVHLKSMQKEYNHYVMLLLYFLDPGKIQYIKKCQASGDERVKASCFIPGKKEYFNSDKVLEVQHLLEHILKDESVKLRLISAVCSYEESSHKTQQQLEAIKDAALLAKILISGILPKTASGFQEDQYIFPPVPNFIFTRDIGIMIKDHILLSRMATTARKRESLITKFLAMYFLFKEDTSKVMEVIEDSDFFLYEEVERKARFISIEGGDIMMIHPKHLIVGCSERTSSNAVNEIVHTIFSEGLGIEKISVVKIAKNRAQMHIDTIFTQVKRNVWVLYGRYSENIIAAENRIKQSYLRGLMHQSDLSALEEPEVLQFYKPANSAYKPDKDYSINKKLPGIEALLKQVSIEDYNCKPEEVKIIYSGGNEFPYDDREQWTDSCNVVVLKEGVVIGYDRNDYTANSFRKEGFDIITTEELFKQFDAGLDPQSLTDTLILLPSAELSRARGGSHCMSMPLLRDRLV
ncbi:MAG TPA: arginine deiminase family protein [Parafilimonas sp.]|nr:arginine deiminase family protein [Parafilimonas sp.]